MERFGTHCTRILLKIHGRVQGVFFRRDTARKANVLGLRGWVRNEDDGTVFIFAEGPREKLEEFRQWFNGGGPPFARIENIEVQWKKGTGAYNDFATF